MPFGASHPIQLLRYVFPIQAVESPLANRFSLLEEPCVKILFY